MTRWGLATSPHFTPSFFHQTLQVSRKCGIRPIGDPVEYPSAPKPCRAIVCKYDVLVIGIEAALWSELLRTPGQMDSQLWPRMMAVSERSWHKAAWEQALEMKSDGKPLRENRDARHDLARFMTLIGTKELRRLEAAGVEYYLPRPGARYVIALPLLLSPVG